MNNHLQQQTTDIPPCWPIEGLEFLGHCPICKNEQRTLVYESLTDRLYRAPGLWTLYNCKSCNSAYLDPRPSQNTISLAYHSYYTHENRITPQRKKTIPSNIRLALRNDYLNWKYGYKEVPDNQIGRWIMYLLPPFFRHEWDAYARHLRWKTSGEHNLLDVGCGTGEFLLQARTAGWQCQGLDLDKKAVEIARRNGLSVDHGDLTSQNYPNESFDAITLSHVIEHIHDPQHFLEECWEKLKPGGIIWITTPNIKSLIHRAFKHDWYSLQSPQHLTIYSKSALTNILLATRFEKIKSHRRGFHIKGRWAASHILQSGTQSHDTMPLAVKFPNSWILELLISVMPALQDDLILTARKPNVSKQKRSL